MKSRPPSTVAVVMDGGDWVQFERFELTHDMAAPSEAKFDLGDDGSLELDNYFRPGVPCQVFIDNALQLTGRTEILDQDGNSGIKLRGTVRTKLSDARVASANPSIAVYDSTLMSFVLKLFEPLGLGPEDFRGIDGFDYSVNLISGKKTKYSKPDPALEQIAPQKAKVQPGQTIFEAAAFHLERHRYILMDSADGKINVLRPNVNAAPIYLFRINRRNNPEDNNVLTFKRSKDWSDIAKVFDIFGNTWGGDVEKAAVHGKAVNEEVAEVAKRTGHFNRRVVQQQNGIKNNLQATLRSLKGLSQTALKADAWTIDVDGLAYYDGGELIKYAPGTICNIDSDLIDAPKGNYMIVKTRATSSEAGQRCTLSLISCESLFF